MYLHILKRIIGIFFIVLILLTIGSIVIEGGLNGFNRVGYNLLFAFIYYIPHSFIASYFIFISLFLFHKNDVKLNKDITNKIIFSPVKLSLFILFISLSILAMNFFLRENVLNYFHPNVSISSSQLSDKEVNKIRGKIYNIIDAFQGIDIKDVIKLVNKLNLEEDSIFLANFFKRVASEFKGSEDILIKRIKKVVPNFEEGYLYAKNKEYDKAIEFFEMQKQMPEILYFIDKVYAAKRYFANKDIKKYKIERLLSLGKTAYTQKQIDEQSYIKYIKTLDYYFPKSSISYNSAKYKPSKVTLDTIKVINRLEKTRQPNPLHKNLYFIDKKMKFLKNKKSLDIGRSIVSIGGIFIHEDNIFLKDIILLSNIDYTDTPPAYLIKYAQWVQSEKKINIFHIRAIFNLEEGNLQSYYIPNTESAALIMSSNIDLANLIKLNKAVKMTSNTSIYDLYYIALNYSENLPPFFRIYLIDKLSYYGSSLIIILIILFLGLFARIRSTRSSRLHTSAIISLFLITLTLICHYLLKSFLMLFLA